MEYKDMRFKVPHESQSYQQDSHFVIEMIQAIIQDAIDNGNNKIILMP